jgi:predicted nucleic acid-binding protein
VEGMSRTSLSFDINKQNWKNTNTFSKMIYVDTNSIIDIFEQRPNGQLTEDYIKETANRDGMIIWSQHTIDEITDFVHVDQYKKYAKANGIKNNHIKAGWKIAEDTVTDLESIHIAINVNQSVEQITSYLEQFGVKTEVDQHLMTNLSRVIYSTYGGNRKDSLHVAIANLSGVNDILTQDSGFLRFPHLNIFGASHGITSNNTVGQAPAKYINLVEYLMPENTEDTAEEDAS